MLSWRMADLDTQLETLKSKHGRLVVAEVNGHTFAFRPLDLAKVSEFKRNLSKSPELAVELSVNVCKFLCIFGQENLDSVVQSCPLAFAGGAEAGVIDVLLENARGGVTFRTI